MDVIQSFSCPNLHFQLLGSIYPLDLSIVLEYPAFNTGTPKGEFHFSESSSVGDVKLNSEDNVRMSYIYQLFHQTDVIRSFIVLEYPAFNTGTPKGEFHFSELSSIGDVKPNSEDEMVLPESQSLAGFPKLHQC